MPKMQAHRRQCRGHQKAHFTMPGRAIRHAVGPNGYRVAQIQDASGEVIAFGLYGPDGALVSQYPDLDAAMTALDAADPPVAMPDEGSPEDDAPR